MSDQPTDATDDMDAWPSAGIDPADLRERDALPDHVDVAPGGGRSAADDEFTSAEFRIDADAAGRQTAGETVHLTLSRRNIDALTLAVTRDGASETDLAADMDAIRRVADRNDINRIDLKIDADDAVSLLYGYAAVDMSDDVPDRLRAHSISEHVEALDAWANAGRLLGRKIRDDAPRTFARLESDLADDAE